MGMRRKSSESSSSGSASTGRYSPPNPNPTKFEILFTKQHGDYLLAFIRFEGCTTFNGIKLLVYETSARELWSRKQIDPHFLDGPEDPIARFPANGAGRIAADAMMEKLAGELT